MNKSILYTIFYENNIYHCVGNNIKKFLKQDHYFVTNSGNSSNPLSTYHENNSKREHILGGYSDLIDFVAKNSETKLIILKGFSKAQSEAIYRFAKNRVTKYELMGTMNMFDIAPDFVHPVFESNGKFYFQNSEDGQTIDSFYEIQGEKHLKKIRPLSNSYNMLVAIKDSYSIGSEPIVAFQVDKNIIYISDVKNFIEFTEDYKPENEIVEQQLSDFKKDIQLSKKFKRPND